MGKKNYIGLLALFLAVLILPVLIQSDYALSILVFMGINSCAIIGLSLLTGYAGQVSLGQAAFFGIGAYSTGVLTTYFHAHIFTAFLFGIVLSTFVAVLIGIPALRLKGHYLAVATLGVAEIVFVCFNELAHWTGGPSGLSNIPGIRIWGFAFEDSRRYFYLVWGVVICITWFTLNVIHSRVGRALRSMRGSEVASAAMGVNLALYKIEVFVLSAIYASIGGTLYAHFMTFVAPANFGLMASIIFLIMAVVGGMANIWGAILGTCLMTFLPEYLRFFQEYDVLAYGIILLLILLFMPEGLFKGVPTLLLRIFKIARRSKMISETKTTRGPI